jgi:hypothetical protein
LVSYKWVSDKYWENYSNAILHLAGQKLFKHEVVFKGMDIK